MKKVKYLLVGLFIASLTLNTACNSKSGATKEISIKIENLNQPGKVLIDQNLSRENGVVSVTAHLKKKIVTIVYDTTKETQAQLIDKLGKLGFK